MGRRGAEKKKKTKKTKEKEKETRGKKEKKGKKERKKHAEKNQSTAAQKQQEREAAAAADVDNDVSKSSSGGGGGKREKSVSFFGSLGRKSGKSAARKGHRSLGGREPDQQQRLSQGDDGSSDDGRELEHELAMEHGGNKEKKSPATIKRTRSATAPAPPSGNQTALPESKKLAPLSLEEQEKTGDRSPAAAAEIDPLPTATAPQRKIEEVCAHLEVSIMAVMGPVCDTLVEREQASSISKGSRGATSRTRKSFLTVGLHQASLGGAQETSSRTTAGSLTEGSQASTTDRHPEFFDVSTGLKGTAAIIAENIKAMVTRGGSKPLWLVDEDFLFDVTDDVCHLQVGLWNKRTWAANKAAGKSSGGAPAAEASVDLGRALAAARVAIRAREELKIDTNDPLLQKEVFADEGPWVPIKTSGKGSKYDGWVRLRLTLQAAEGTVPLKKNEKAPRGRNQHSSKRADRRASGARGGSSEDESGDDDDDDGASPLSSPRKFYESVATHIVSYSGAVEDRPEGFLAQDFSFFAHLDPDDSFSPQAAKQLVRQIFAGETDVHFAANQSMPPIEQVMRTRDAASLILAKIASGSALLETFVRCGGISALCDGLCRKYGRLLGVSEPTDMGDVAGCEYILLRVVTVLCRCLVLGADPEHGLKFSGLRREFISSGALVQPLLKIAARSCMVDTLRCTCWLLSQLCSDAFATEEWDDGDASEAESSAAEEYSDPDLRAAQSSQRVAQTGLQHEDSWWSVTGGVVQDSMDSRARSTSDADLGLATDGPGSNADVGFSAENNTEAALRRAVLRNCQDVAIFGGVRPFVRLMADHPHTLGAACLTLLVAVAKVPENRGAIIRADGLRHIASLFSLKGTAEPSRDKNETEGHDKDSAQPQPNGSGTEEDNLGVSEEEVAATLARSACVLLCNLAVGTTASGGASTVAHICVTEHKVLPKLKDLVHWACAACTDEESASHKAVLEATIACLATLLSDDVGKATALEIPGLLASVVTLLAPSQSLPVRSEAARCVTYLSSHGECRDRLVEKTRVVALLERTLGEFATGAAQGGSKWPAGRERVVSAAVWALAGLTSSATAADELTVETLQIVVLLLARENLHEPASWCLAHVARHGNNAERVLAGGGAAALASVLTGVSADGKSLTTPSARTAARAALVALAESSEEVSQRISMFVGDTALHPPAASEELP